MHRNARGNVPGPSSLRQSIGTTKPDRDRDRVSSVDGSGPRTPDTTASNSTTRHMHHQHHSRNGRQERRCTVTVNESFSRDEVLLNLDLFDNGIKPGSLMAIEVPPEKSGHASLRKMPTQDHLDRDDSSMDASQSGSSTTTDRRYLFIVKDMSKDMKLRHPKVELYVAKHVAEAFGMKKGGHVYLIPEDANNPSIEASHVELSFRDQYLSRADMWRMAVGELSERTVYQGQVIYFLGTCKAQVSAVFVDGRKVRSAFFGRHTRPIYRSESARYILFIQMSREMWDFDSDGSGEIMFNKVVNGFLPALFKKWMALKLKHLVSIVLFARVEYDTGISTEFAETALHDSYFTGTQKSGNKRPYKDFYRVVVSEKTSVEWTSILYHLKREFGIFRRDISLHHQQALNPMQSVSEEGATKQPYHRQIRAESSLATHGNFLEAINLASTVYAHDYIDRDLMRTGISVVVISPGAGVFEVDYEELRRTTEALVGNGIGIDLICVPKIPLHSVPLFRYKKVPEKGRRHSEKGKSHFHDGSTPKYHTPAIGSYTSALGSSLSPIKNMSVPPRGDHSLMSHASNDEWSYALPQWLHVSYWTGNSDEALSYQGIALSASDNTCQDSQDEFAIRCRMYDLQMRSVLETNEIETTPLHADPSFPRKLIQPLPLTKFRRHDVDGVTLIPNLRHTGGLVDHVSGFQKFAPDKHAKPGEKTIWRHLQEYDDTKAHLPASRRHSGFRPRDNGDNVRMHGVESGSYLGASMISERRVSINYHQSPLPSVSSKSSSGKTPKFMRQISLGQRGFGIAAPKVAVAEVQVENVAAATSMAAVSGSRSPLPVRMTPVKSNSQASQSPQALTAIRDSPIAERAQESGRSSRLAPSRPIHIRNNVQSSDSTLFGTVGTMISSSVIRHAGAGPDAPEIKYSNALRAEDAQKVGISKLRAGEMPDQQATLSPSAAVSPWLTVLNPCNPEANKVDETNLYSRWQHVFPRPSEMKVMKWKSLCTPAAVPLTTEHFPTQAQFDSEYQRQPYNVSQEFDDELTEEPKTREELLKELISLRFSQGFQVVVGQAVAKAFGQKQMKIADILSRDHSAEDGTSIFLSVGNTIHQLSCVNGTEVEVNIFTRKPALQASNLEQPEVYKPSIRTIMDEDYVARQIDIATPKPERNWNYIDSYVAGHDLELSESFRFWRARFVLIPIVNRTSLDPAAGEKEEETRIEGIRRLGKLWQKHRYIPPSDRRFQDLGPRHRKDPNPLDIVYKTDDPSVVIAAELETLPLLEGLEAGHRRAQLVTNKHQFRKSSLNLAQLAEAIQQPVESGGVRMQNRRWHLRLHYNCFIGSDMIDWMLDNFEDLDSREEAEALGNVLMISDEDKLKDKEKDKDREKDKDKEKEGSTRRESGIFVHVEKRHRFKDGQYFYQISSDFAKPQPSTWFNQRWREASVPSTPVSEQPPRDSIRNSISHTLSEEESLTSGTTTPTAPILPSGGNKPRVMLSKVMKYDVDHRKRSYRPERIDLHYDRLHNPDNCYHLRIDWMNVTAKLIEDAVEGWAREASLYGLRLVEVPIAEACTISDVNPFRKPFPIKLAVPPPDRQPVTFYDPTSFSPLAQPAMLFYQKAILRKFDFVLDMESASSFPSNVDVTYSWGKPEFKYTQYIHRSGILLAEITDEGDFLILANRLYSNRAQAARDKEMRKEEEQQQHKHRQGGGGVGGNGGLPGHSHVADLTPLSSPLFRAVNTTGSPKTTGQGAAGAGSHGNNAAQGGEHNSALIKFSLDEPNSIRLEMEKFCHDPVALEAFYSEMLEKAPGPQPASSIMAPTIISQTGSGAGPVADHNIPNFPSGGLPQGLLSSSVSGDALSVMPSPVQQRVQSPAVLAASQLLRRGSVQY
ncbi:hypothetical protein PspLS_06803 [Pyricularia sp. CBS 133598]|nr:hypothetical protein PspLS_06803 [Pyricularia sp. CBS 133598]